MSLRSPRTQFRACKISKFPGGVSQTLITQYCGAPLFVFVLDPPPNPLGGPGHKVPSMLSGHILIFSVAILYLLHMTGDLYLNTLNLKLTLTLSCLNPGVHFQGGWGMRRTLTVKKLGGRGSLDLFSQLMQCSQVPRGKGGWARLWQGGQMHVGVR